MKSTQSTRSVTELLASANPATWQSGQRGSHSETTPERRTFLTAIFAELTRMKLLTAPSEEALSEIYRTWGRELSDLPESAIRYGLARCKDFKGWFSLPAFRELCKVSAADLGMPDPHKAYLEAARSDGQRDRIQWSHPAVYHAGRETGWFELRTMTERECYPLFRLNYESMVARVLNGEELTTPVQKAIPAKIPNLCSQEENLARVAKLKELL